LQDKAFQHINNIDWPNGTSGGLPIRFTLTYNADGSGVIRLFNSSTNAQLGTRTFPAPAAPATGLRVGNAVRVWVKSNAGIGVGAKIKGVVEEIDGVVLTTPIALETAGDNNYSEATRVIALSAPVTSGTMAIKGTFLLSWSGTASAIPTGSRLNATINAGTITCGSGSTSQVITGLSTTPAAPLSYTLPPNNTVGLSATGGASGNPVVFASTTPTICTVGSTTVDANNLSTATLTTLAAGTCNVTADQAGGAVGGTTYSAAPQVTASILINKASQVITGFAPTSPLSYFAPPNNTITLSAQGGASGTPVMFSASTPTVCATGGTNGATLTILSAGTCSLAADQAGNDNFNPAQQVTASITISKASQVITNFTPPASISQAVGSMLALSATGGGVGNSGSGNPVTFSTTTSSICTTGGTNGATLTVQGAGTCTISANQAGNDNYTAAPAVSASISITVPAQLYFIHPDHLGTPRAITKASDNTKVWEWKNDDPFGANLPDENPNGASASAFKYHLRFPGQYFDEETGMHYNYFRDYEPTTGRYVQSDPIGLWGGLNTYAYVEAKPLQLVDPTGEFGVPGAFAGAGINLGAQVVTCMALGGSLSTCMKCVDMLDVFLSGVSGAMGFGTLQVIKGQLNLARSAAALTSVMGPVGGSVARSSQAAIVKQYAKEKAATGAAKLATPPVACEDKDECKKYKLMQAASTLF
jgi:RHS repeat-associated protein